MNRGLVASLALHGGLFVLILLGPGPSRFEWERADAIPVDLVQALEPEVEQEPLPEPPKPQIDPPQDPVEESSAPDPVPEVERPDPKPVTQPKNPKPRRVYRPLAPRRDEDEDQPSLEERLKARLSDAAAEAQDSLRAWSQSEARPSSVSSTELEASDFPYAWYLNIVQTKITDSWDPPAGRMVAGHGNRVLLRFRVHRDGRVTDIAVEGGSDTPGLDASARRAVDRARPFPPLPETYEGEVLDIGVRFIVGSGR